MNEPQISPRSLAMIRGIDRFVVHISRHWLLYAGAFLFVFSTLPFVAPLLMILGWELPANAIYYAYSFTCHQLAYRSFFIDGAQLAYTVPQLQDLLQVPNNATDLWYWRGVIGNMQLGFKMAYCERDAAMYSTMFFATVLYALVRKSLPRLPWRWYLILGILPILIDGGTQLFMLRESTALLRVITGVLFGALTVWLIYPHVDEAMSETYSQSADQLARISRRIENSP
ncbi:MAG: DUF2085 domain-containing protein [Rudaea sp.]